MAKLEELRVKICSLAAEAQIIRRRERVNYKRGRYEIGNSLHNHRRGVVRYEARHSLFAYAYLRGKPRTSVETHTEFVHLEGSMFRATLVTGEKPVNWSHVRKIAERFSSQPITGDFEAWAKAV